MRELIFSDDGQSEAVMSPEGLGLRLFHTQSLCGTRAVVRLTDRQPDWNKARELSQSDNVEASCWTWRERNGIRVRCFGNGQPIRFCGHGLLACAYTWKLTCTRELFPLTLHTDVATYTAHITNEDLWLHCPRIQCRPALSIPEGWFDHRPIAAAEAGGNNGYWVLCWPGDFDLGVLNPGLTRMAAQTRRGIIATAAAPGTDNYDAVLRYFAPAHGNPEDTVTGSAAVVLADYWQNLCTSWPQSPTLRLRQDSPGGGRINVRLSGTTVALNGTVEEAPL